MKMSHFLKSLILFFIAGFISSNLQAQNARIKIDLDRTIGEVNKNIYGNFVEHLGRCVYGGIYDPDSPFADEDGFRTDVLEAARDLNIPLVRYPGGNFVSNYNWKDGVGPERTKRLELAWARLETNEVGTNEFMKWANKLGTEPYFAVNLGTGTIREARQWVEYCNVKEGPYYAELRKKHGFPEPHNIKYWSLGNEMDGHWQMGHLNAIDYSKKAREAGKLMRLTSPDIKLIAAGSSNYRPDANPDEWNRTVLEELKDYIDYIALHIYVGNPDNNYYNFMATPLVIEERTKIVEGMINEVMQRTVRRHHTNDPIYIAWDEYNVWYRARSGDTMTGERALEEHYNLEDALVIGGMLNAFIRNAHIVKMANMAQLVNVIGPIFTNKDDMYKQTIYYPLELFANNMHGTSLDVFVDCETYDTEEFYLGLGETTTQQSDVPYLDVSATYQDNNVTIAVVNRHKDKAITTDIISQSGDFDGKLEVYEVNGPDIKAENDFDQTNVKTERKEDIKANDSVVTYAFPPHSITLLKGKIKQ
jgi:alpha-N-arabinofuranosidase